MAWALVAAAFATSVASTEVAAADQDESLQVRIAARMLDGGSMEFALQQRRGGTWGIRQLPARRFMPAGATPGRWLTSSPLPVAGIQVRIAARNVDGESIELALQRRHEGTWGTRQLPTRRLIPADAAPGRWHTSSTLTPAGATATPTQPEWTLLAAGDVLMDRTEPAGIDPFAGIEPPLATGDLAIVNVEMAISDRGAPIGKQFTFRAPSSAAQRIADAGIDVANLANNHAKDYGAQALTDTIASLEAAGVVALGAGANDGEAYQHRLLEVDGGVTVAFVGVSMIVPWSFPAGPDTPGIATGTDPERVLGSVRTAAGEADVVIAVVHWGIEVATCPSAEQRAFAGALFDAGADAVIGHHPHVLQSIEFDDGRLVAYSLGNFVWHPRWGITGETGVLQIDFAGDRILGWEFHPHLLDGNGAPRPAGRGWRVDRLGDLIEGDCERYAGTTPYDLTRPEGASGSAAQPDVELRHFSARQFKELLDSVTLPNLTDIVAGPAMTGDAQTDERIRQIAEDRGYRLQPVVASPDELVSVEQQLLQPEAARLHRSQHRSPAGRQSDHPGVRLPWLRHAGAHPLPPLEGALHGREDPYGAPDRRATGLLTASNGVRGRSGNGRLWDQRVQILRGVRLVGRRQLPRGQEARLHPELPRRSREPGARSRAVGVLLRRDGQPRAVATFVAVGFRVSAGTTRIPRHRLTGRPGSARQTALDVLLDMRVAPSQGSKPSVMLAFDTLSRMHEAGVAPRELADWLIGRGLHFVSTVEAAEILGVPAAAVPASLERSRQAGKLVSVTKGGWVPVPAEYRPVGAPPASHFIDPMMEHLGHSYYVGFLSAAAAHGAAHQSPMVFQVVTPARLRDRRIGRSRIEFIQRAAAAQRPRARRDVPTGRIWVSTPEVTALDLVEAPGEGAGLSNVATIIGEFLLDEVLDADELASIAGAYPTAVAQRAGYLIDRMAAEVGASFDTSPLHGRIGEARRLPLTSGEGASNADTRWRVVAPVPLEHDL